MALHGSVCANLSPILFKGNNVPLGLNVILHLDESGSMTSVKDIYANGGIIGELQDAFLENKIGTNLESYPNVYAFFSTYGRNPSNAFSITNSYGTLNVTQSFIRGEATKAETVSRWVNNYYGTLSNHLPNVCSLLPLNNINQRSRLDGVLKAYPGAISEDVHGNIWSIFTTPNAIPTGTPGRFGSLIGSPVRRGATTIVITASNEQSDFWGKVTPNNLINVQVPVQAGTRTINGSNGEVSLRKYKIVALSSYKSIDGYDGILFYGANSPQPYGYVKFTGNSTYTVTRSNQAPTNTWGFTFVNNGNSGLRQVHNTLLLAEESRGCLFKIYEVFGTGGIDRRVAFSKCLSEFIIDTVVDQPMTSASVVGEVVPIVPAPPDGGGDNV